MGRLSPLWGALVLTAVVGATAWSVARFVAEGADVPAHSDVTAAAASITGLGIGDDDVIVVAPPWSMAPLQALGPIAWRAVAADGPWDALHTGRHRRVCLWTEPDADPWLAGRDHRVLASAVRAGARHFGVIDVVAIDDVPARTDFTRRFDDARVSVTGAGVDGDTTLVTCTDRRRGAGGGVRCAGQPRSVRAAHEWAQVTENGADVIVVNPPQAPAALRIDWDDVEVGPVMVVAAGHLRQAVGVVDPVLGTITIDVLVDDAVVGQVVRRPAFVVEPQRRALVQTFVHDLPPATATNEAGGFVVTRVDTAAVAGPHRRVSFVVHTAQAEGNGCGIDAFVPGG